MGIIAKQSTYNMIILIIGVVFGAVNNIFLFQIFLTQSQFGIVRFLPLLGFLAGSIALLGSSQMLLKFVPEYKTDQRPSGGILRISVQNYLVGLIIVLALLFEFKHLLIESYRSRASMIEEYFHLVYIITISYSASELLSAYLQSVLKSTFQLALKEVLYRILQSVIVVLFYLQIISFEVFVTSFSFLLVINVIILLIYLVKSNLFDLRKNIEATKKRVEIFSYSITNFLSTISGTIISNIDGIMIPALVPVPVLVTSNYGLELTAIYTFGVYIVSLCTLPGRAISNIAVSVISAAWLRNDKKVLTDIYSKSSINQLMLGSLIFGLIWINIDSFFEIFPKYQESKNIIMILGIARLIHVGGGLNGVIIITSKHYKFGLYNSIALMILTVLTNYYMIPRYGIEGAALATLFSLTIFNVISFFFLLIKFGLQPFSMKTLFGIILTISLIACFYYLDLNLNPFVEMLLNSVLFTAIFSLISYKLNITPDIHDLAQKFLGRKKST